MTEDIDLGLEVVTYTCSTHNLTILAASLEKGEYLCQQCLSMPEFLQDTLGFFQDFLKENYEVVSTLGETQNTKVFKVVNRFDGMNYSVKVVPQFEAKDIKEQNAIVDEVLKQMTMRHKNVLKMKHALVTQGQLYSIQELGLFNVSQRFDKTRQKRILGIEFIINLLEGVQYLHQNSVVHGDIKPSNLIILKEKQTDREILKVTDYGVSKDFQNEQIEITGKAGFVGSFAYFAPEIHEQNQSEKFEVLKKQDVWSIGIIIHQILVQMHPFTRPDMTSLDDLKIAIINGEYLIHSTLMGTIYQKIIQSCFRLKPKKRAEIEQLLEIFRIIYAIYLKYSTQEEAERVLMMESYRVRGITYQEEIVSKKDIRKGVKNILDFDDEAPGKRVRKVKRTIIEEDEGRRRKKKPRGGDEYYLEEQVIHKKKKKKRGDDDDGYYYDYDYETHHIGGGDGKKRKKKNRKQPGDEWEWETFWEYGPNGEEIEVKRHGDIEEYWSTDEDGNQVLNRRKKMPDGSYWYGEGGKDEWHWEYDENGNKIKVKGPKIEGKSSAGTFSEKSDNGKNCGDGWFEEDEGQAWHWEQSSNGKWNKRPGPGPKLDEFQKYGPTAYKSGAASQMGYPKDCRSGRGWGTETNNFEAHNKSKDEDIDWITDPETGEQYFWEYEPKQGYANKVTRTEWENRKKHQRTPSNLSAIGGGLLSQLGLSGSKTPTSKSFVGGSPFDTSRLDTNPGNRTQKVNRTTKAVPGYNFENEIIATKVHKSMCWSVIALNQNEFITCSNDKTIKIWSVYTSQPRSTITLKQPVNSICVADNYIIAGTFTGGVAKIDISNILEPKEEIYYDKKHTCYVSSVLGFKQTENELFGTLSADSLIIWNLKKMEEVGQCHLGFRASVDYKWWSMCEIDGTLQDGDLMVVAVCSSQDCEIRIIQVNVETGECEIKSRLKQEFHPRQVIQLANPQLILTVGILKEIGQDGGAIEIHNIATGESIGYWTEKNRVCSVAALWTEKDMHAGNDHMTLMFGSNSQKVIEYDLKDDDLQRVKEIDLIHKKSIFGICFLDYSTLITAGLDANLVSSKIYNSNESHKLDIPGLAIPGTSFDIAARRSMNKSNISGIDAPPFDT